MINLNDKYKKKRETREKDRLSIELKYKEGLLFLKNEEVDEWMEICSLIHKGEELAYTLERATLNLGKAVRERDALLDEIEAIKRELNGEDEFI